MFMQKGKSYGKQAFRTHQIKEKNINEVAEDYYNLCTIRGTAEVTIKGYKYALNYFNEFNGDNPIDCDSVNMYILFLKKKGFKDTTINSYVRKLSPIFKFGHSKGYLPKVEINEIKVQKTFKDIYSEQEMNLLLKQPKEKDFVSIRNWCMVWVFASTAIRRSELINLKVMNVDMVNRVIGLNHTKNRKCRYIPISSSLYEVLEIYLNSRNYESADEYLFCSVYNTVLSTSTINKELEKYNHSRGITQTGIHKYRHTFITNAVNNNTNVLLLQKLTGHSTLKELNTYYNANTKDKASIIDEIAPKSLTRKNMFAKK